MNRRSQQTVVFADSDTGGIIHVANIKGGVGKSTVATNLAAALAKKGPTLLIDLDVQGSASVALGVNAVSCTVSSWELFRCRFAAGAPEVKPSLQAWSRAGDILKSAEQKILPWFVGSGDITSITRKISPGLDLIPANADLFKSANFLHLQNLAYNLQLCRNYYKYIVLDTPSVWNNLTKSLYRLADLNLVPVTLTALSTKSLREYLQSVRGLAERFRNIRIRIVKNEVFGNDASKIKGKTRTMGENRRFLEKLCEQVTVRSATGLSVLPQSILFDMEIPESAVVRDAQDEGIAVAQLHQYSAATKAFEDLARRVQYVLNECGDRLHETFWERHHEAFTVVSRAAAVLALAVLFGMQPPVSEGSAPRPIAPQQLIDSPDGFLQHTFTQGESLFKLAKYAICRFRAVVPGTSDVHAYVREVIEVHNRTRTAGEPVIEDAGYIEPGMSVTFYPPAVIRNPRQKQLVPVYQFFTGIVDDPYSYVTGDWCERGIGGGTPHYGIDIAANNGSTILSPVNGTAVVTTSKSAGREVAVINEGTALFFCHMDDRYVKTGQQIHKGDALGTVGMTGQTSGPHVHIGYGIRSPDAEGVLFGSSRYKLTDPKLFFYREVFVTEMQNKG